MTDEKKPKIIDIKRKPKITDVKEPIQNEDEEANDFSDLVDDIPGPADLSRESLRRKQLEDITPNNPEEELKKEKKKRFRLF